MLILFQSLLTAQPRPSCNHWRKSRFSIASFFVLKQFSTHLFQQRPSVHCIRRRQAYRVLGSANEGRAWAKKTSQGFLATIYLLCQTLWNKSNNNNRPRPRLTRMNRKTKECLPLQRCVECGPCHAKQLGHLRGAFALRDEFPRVGDLLRGELRLTPQLHPTPIGRVEHRRAQP